MLKIENLCASYSGNCALDTVSMHIDEGEIVCLIGANGAGKTTLLNCISGLMRKTGKIFFRENNITDNTTPEIVRHGIIQVPENRQLFNPLTVEENLILGSYLECGSGKSRIIKQKLEMILEKLPALKPKLQQRAGTLSGGEQQMVAIGRALMSNPQLLLLDEPSLGLAPLVVKEIFRLIQELKHEGTTILLVEQNALGALTISDKAYVMETGKIKLYGRAEELLHDRQIREAFLGQEV